MVLTPRSISLLLLSLLSSFERILSMCDHLGIDPTREFYLIPIADHALSTPHQWVKVQSTNGGMNETYVESPSENEMKFFKDLVEMERARFEATKIDNSPWIKITETFTQQPSNNQFQPPFQNNSYNQTQRLALSALPTSISSTSSSSSHPASSPPSNSPTHTRAYYYNFKTFRSAPTLPPVKCDSFLPPLNRRMSDRHDLDVLKFESYWYEGRVKRLIKIHYYLASEEFEIILLPTVRADFNSNSNLSCESLFTPSSTSSHESQIYRAKSLRTKHTGATVGLYDLHVNAQLDIFGRTTTLLQCELGNTDSQRK